MGKDDEKGIQEGYSSGSEEEHRVLPRTQNQSSCRGFLTGSLIVNEGKVPINFYFCFLLMLVACFVLLPQMEGIKGTLGGTRFEQSPKSFMINVVTNPNVTTCPHQQDTVNTSTPTPNPPPLEKTPNPPPLENSENSDMPIPNPPLQEQTQNTVICPTNMTQPLTCPASLPQGNPFTKAQDDLEASSSTDTESCPDYFRWIHEDLKPWKETGITREAIEAAERHTVGFRIVVLDGRVYVKQYRNCYQTRDEFTIWGIVQLLRVYPGKIPDFDMMFECGDEPVIRKDQYEEAAANGSSPIPVVFGYCGQIQTFDISFPDWSFWGWHEVNIKPWKTMLEDLKEGNKRVKWVDRVPYAYWKGNYRTGWRFRLLPCNSTKYWNAEIYPQNWRAEARGAFKYSNVADQCTHRYKIYMEGRAWSASEKYLQACDSMLLFILPRYWEFFTRSLVPLKHYWPINPWKTCSGIKFAVDWGNNNTEQAQEIGKAGSKFILEELKMKYIYDYMFHLLNGYARLFKYKPTIPSDAVEVCLESMVCNSQGNEKQYKIESMAKGPSQTSPCAMPPPYDPQELDNFQKMKEQIHRNVIKWTEIGDTGEVNF